MCPIPPAADTFRFGDFEIDVMAYELRYRKQSVPIERRPMDLLLFLVERRGQLVSRREIVERLWGPDVFVEVEAGINTVVWKLRGALGDSSESSTFVQTVPGKGYRFVAPVEIAAPSRPEVSPASLAALETLPDARRDNLPAELTSFVGRGKELRELPAMVRSSRLVTLTGAGGVGKTRLALRLASDLVAEIRDGVWMVDLASLSEPALIAPTIAAVLGIREGPQRSSRDALLDSLRQ